MRSRKMFEYLGFKSAFITTVNGRNSHRKIMELNSILIPSFTYAFYEEKPLFIIPKITHKSIKRQTKGQTAVPVCPRMNPCAQEKIMIYPIFRSFLKASMLLTAFSLSSASAKIRRSGSVPEKRQLTKPPSAK